MTWAVLGPGVTGSPFAYVLFDMDGTLVDEMSSWEWVHDHFGVDNEAHVEAYLDGRFDDERFIREDIRLWREVHGGPVPMARVAKLLDQAPLMAGARELLEAVHALEVPTAIVSAGIQCLARRVASELGIDEVRANELSVDEDGYLTGQGVCHVRLKDKGAPARTAIEAIDGQPGDGLAIGNSRFDVPLFEAAGTGVAFAPVDDAVREAADVVVEGRDLADVTPVLEGGKAS